MLKYSIQKYMTLRIENIWRENQNSPSRDDSSATFCCCFAFAFVLLRNLNDMPRSIALDFIYFTTKSDRIFICDRKLTIDSITLKITCYSLLIVNNIGFILKSIETKILVCIWNVRNICAFSHTQKKNE